MPKKTRLILIFILLPIIISAMIFVIQHIMNKNTDSQHITNNNTVKQHVVNNNKKQHEILTKKFYFPVKESYKILFFENVEGDVLEKHCYATLNLSESEYTELKLELEKAEYEYEDILNSLEWYKKPFENHSDWLDGEKVVEGYLGYTVESGDRIHMNVYITKSENGYRQVYLTRD